MMLRLHDTLTRATREFQPLRPGHVTMYNCGPTVYSYPHIGNYRYFLFTDLLRRTLEWHGFTVNQVMNITDVGHMLADADTGEDKMDVAAKAAGKTPQEIAVFYTAAFLADMHRLNVREPAHRPKASEHVAEMITIIQTLLDHGHAYQVGGDVYYDVSSFPNYGQLSGNTIEGLDPGARIAVRTDKKHPADFALWISNPNHLQLWDAPWSRGYPGWHIECSAMAQKYLGNTIDIHTGGEDNKFPHHECEIAQTEGATNQPFANFWLHTSHLLVDGEKMSKSKNNFFRLDDLLAKGYSAAAIRWYLLSTHYRQQMNFTFDGLDAAKVGLDRLQDFSQRLNEANVIPGPETRETVAATTAFSTGLNDDLNVSAALASVFDWMHAVNEYLVTGTITSAEKEAAQKFISDIENIFGVSLSHPAEEIPAPTAKLAAERVLARQTKDFAASDRLRKEIEDLGWSVEDTASGQRLRKRRFKT